MVLRVSAGRMVGREDEIGRLLRLLDDAEAGRSVVALVSGDAGVGKSRLVAEGTRLAPGRGVPGPSGQGPGRRGRVPLPPLPDAPRGAPRDPSALADHLTAAAQGGMGATELNDIMARAEGNAYYAEELLAASVSGDRPEQSLPAGLAALLLSRVEQLSDAAQQVLRAAAVAGRQADDELVQAASGLVSTEDEAAVREAVTHQLLVPDGTEGYVFRHALLRQAVYGDLLPGERTRLHGTMSALLADEHRLATPGTAAELAQHCLASHDIPGAFAASIRAGEEAERLGAPAEAHPQHDQARGLGERGAEPEKTAGMHRGKLGLPSAANAADSGDLDPAVHLRPPLPPAVAPPARRGGGAAPARPA